MTNGELEIIETIEVNGQTKEVTPELIKEREEEITEIAANNPMGSISLLNMGAKAITKHLKKRDKAIMALVGALVLNRHYYEIQGIKLPFLSQDGADFLAGATGLAFTYEKIKEEKDYDHNYVNYDYKAIAHCNGVYIGSGEASANTQEENHKKVYMELKNDVWVQRTNKSVFDVLNTVIQKAQIRAKKKAVRNILGIAGLIGQDPELIDNPEASKHLVFSIYRLLYKEFLSIVPEQPIKKKLKNNKWKMYTDKERLDLAKEWLRVNMLQPFLLHSGIPTTGWGIKDIEIIKAAIPNLEIPGTKELPNGNKPIIQAQNKP